MKITRESKVSFEVKVGDDHADVIYNVVLPNVETLGEMMLELESVVLYDEFDNAQIPWDNWWKNLPAATFEDWEERAKVEIWRKL